MYLQHKGMLQYQRALDTPTYLNSFHTQIPLTMCEAMCCHVVQVGIIVSLLMDTGTSVYLLNKDVWVWLK